MESAVTQSQSGSTDERTPGKWGFQAACAVIRMMFGLGWLLAGATKILGETGSSEHSWFAEPGVFITGYLTKTLDKPNVPEFYKWFVENIALDQIMFLNYVIPIVQVMVGLFLIAGLCAFCLLLCGNRMYAFSLDRLLRAKFAGLMRNGNASNQYKHEHQVKQVMY